MRSAFMLFHCNLMFSSVEIDDRNHVIKNCYWPLLNWIEEHDVIVGVELTGYTLETIQAIDPRWVRCLQELIRQGKVEFVGSGYCQVIGTLVPHRIFQENIELGKKVYQQYFGDIPQLWLPNELSISPQLLHSYHRCGINSIILEKENHSALLGDTVGADVTSCIALNEKESLNTLWIDSTSFQKFQRFVHGEIDRENLVHWVENRINESTVCALYTNDAEVFNYRPGRYGTELEINANEWKKISELCHLLQSDYGITFQSPSAVIQHQTQKKVTLKAHVEHAIAVKKQAKYNATRWAVTGRDDLALNTLCHRYYKHLLSRENSGEACQENWKHLLFWWSSDFRTHITEKRWKQLLLEASHIVSTLEGTKQYERGSKKARNIRLPFFSKSQLSITELGRLLIIENDRFRVELNQRKGLAIHRFYDRERHNDWIYGTLEQGELDNPKLSADFFSGSLTYDIPFQSRITDLANVKPTSVSFSDQENTVYLSIPIMTHLGSIIKMLRFSLATGILSVRWDIEALGIELGALRYGYLTINPKIFGENSVSLETHNGGQFADVYHVGDDDFDHGSAVSFKTSSNNAFGMTENTLKITNGKLAVEYSRCAKDAASVAMSSFYRAKNGYLFRVWQSAREVDETAKYMEKSSLPSVHSLECSIQVTGRS